MMKKTKIKSLTMSIMMGMMISFNCTSNAQVVESATIVPEASSPVVFQTEIQQPTNQETKAFKAPSFVNWHKGPSADIEAIGVGFPPVNSGQRGMMLARRAAMVDAYRVLAETIQGVQIDSETTMKDLAIADDSVSAKVSALIKGAYIIEEGTNDDGSYYMKMCIPMFGKEKSVAAVAIPSLYKNTPPTPLPKVTETTLPKPEIKELQKVNYTGVVIDADNMGLEATFAPVIFDTNGRIVYGIENLDKNKAISDGMVSYANELQNATNGTRAGDNPLVIKAKTIKSGKNSVNPVNVVISVEDADRILLANKNTQILNNACVVFVK